MGQVGADLTAASTLLAKIEACTEKTPLHKAVWDQVTKNRAGHATTLPRKGGHV